MTTKQQEISESKETEKIVIREIKPILPREIWEIIFYLIPIRDKLTCSKLIIEFRDFYQELFTNYEKYVDSFRDFKVEKASLNGLNLCQMHPYFHLVLLFPFTFTHGSFPPGFCLLVPVFSSRSSSIHLTSSLQETEAYKKREFVRDIVVYPKKLI